MQGEGIAPGFEVFNDPAYFDMWAVRPDFEKDFNSTLHFGTWQEAAHASWVALRWCTTARSAHNNDLA